MSLNVTVFEAVAPEFAGLTDTSQRDTLAGLAENQISEDIWTTRYDHAVALLTAHMMKLSAAGQTGFPISSEKVGDVSRSYSVPAGFMEYDATPYGREFVRLRRQILRTPVIVA